MGEQRGPEFNMPDPVELSKALGSIADRSQKISEQLPEALEMMTRSLRAGHALETAFQLVASEAPNPINTARAT